MLLLAIGAVAYGQNVHYDRGYAWSLGVGAYTGSALERAYEGIGASVYLEQGFNFGNGLFVGGGFGAVATTDMAVSVYNGMAFPVFAEVRYSFLDKGFSPFASFKTGALLCHKGPFFAPAIGFDFGRCSLQLQYINYPDHYIVENVNDRLQWLGLGLRDGGRAVSVNLAVNF